jgi:hypothetical protein
MLPEGRAKVLSPTLPFPYLWIPSQESAVSAHHDFSFWPL